MSTVLITGANRGLGFEYARGFGGLGWRVIACCRKPEDAQDLANLSGQPGHAIDIRKLDVTDVLAAEALAADLSDQPLNLLVNNAGTFGPLPAMEGAKYQSLENMDYDIWRQMFEVNVISLFHISTLFLGPLAQTGGAIVNLSSDLGSIENNRFGSSHAYRSTKSAVNMLTKGMAIELAEQGITVVSMAPGWCRTDLGGEQAELDPAESINDQMSWLPNLDASHSGRFLDRFGNDVAW